MKKIAAIVISVILACSFMAGCGDKDDSSSKKPDNSNSEVSSVGESANSKDEASSEADESSKDDKSEPDNSGLDEDDSTVGTDEFYVDERLIGKWQAIYITEGDETYTVDYDDIPVSVLRFTFNEDNTGKYFTPEFEKDFKWSMNDGEGFAFDINNVTDRITLKLADGELVVIEYGNIEDAIIGFKQVDEFEEIGSETDGSKPAADKYVGKWECSKLVIGDKETNGDDDLGNGLTLSKAISFEFKADGTGSSFSKLSSSGGYTEQFTWSVEGDSFTIYLGGQEIPVKISGDELTVDTSSSKISLRRIS